MADDNKTNNTYDMDVLRANINNETSQISWHELQRFFAGGWLIYVSNTTSILDIAVAFSQDNKEQVSKWLNTGEVAKVTDKQAKQWHSSNASFWATVVRPWVLIQPVTQTGNSEPPHNFH